MKKSKIEENIIQWEKLSDRNMTKEENKIAKYFYLAGKLDSAMEILNKI